MAKDRRTCERVLQAAAQVECVNDREAAILGGIVGSLLGTGHFTSKYVEHHTVAALDWSAFVGMQLSDTINAHGVIDKTSGLFVGVTPPRHEHSSPPSKEEIAAMVERFVREYDPPRQEVAA